MYLTGHARQSNSNFNLQVFCLCLTGFLPIGVRCVEIVRHIRVYQQHVFFGAILRTIAGLWIEAVARSWLQNWALRKRIMGADL